MGRKKTSGPFKWSQFMDDNKITSNEMSKILDVIPSAISGYINYGTINAKQLKLLEKHTGKNLSRYCRYV
jgi:hypothetical protein